jgi:Enoyl-(Acyl carrier protein) reductase
MRGLANDIANDGITANAVLPGLTNTLATASQSDEQKRATWEQQAIKRMGQPEDVATAGCQFGRHQFRGWLCRPRIPAGGVSRCLHHRHFEGQQRRNRSWDQTHSRRLAQRLTPDMPAINASLEHGSE